MTLAPVNIQHLDHTISCTAQVHKIIFTKVTGKNTQKTVLVSKCECDCSTECSRYNKGSPANGETEFVPNFTSSNATISPIINRRDKKGIEVYFPPGCFIYCAS
jgi:hypothetical protein